MALNVFIYYLQNKNRIIVSGDLLSYKAIVAIIISTVPCQNNIEFIWKYYLYTDTTLLSFEINCIEKLLKLFALFLNVYKMSLKCI